ncbi:hypothetical protein LguiB_032274 [Lonicera macranthoides]
MKGNENSASKTTTMGFFLEKSLHVINNGFVCLDYVVSTILKFWIDIEQYVVDDNFEYCILV